MTSIKHTSGFDISQPVENIFPLFSPEGEKLWVPGWDYEKIMATTSLCEDYVFLTNNHDHASSAAIWLVKKYQPEVYHVQFYKVEPEVKVGIVTVQCSKQSEGLTNVNVSYEYIGLSEQGNNFIRAFTKAEYENFIAEWKQLLSRFFDSEA